MVNGNGAFFKISKTLTYLMENWYLPFTALGVRYNTEAIRFVLVDKEGNKKVLIPAKLSPTKEGNYVIMNVVFVDIKEIADCKTEVINSWMEHYMQYR